VKKRRSAHVGFQSIRVASGVANLLPHRVARAVPRVTAPLAVRLARANKRELVLRHQERARGRELYGDEAHKVLVATYRSYIRYWVESFRLPGSNWRELETAMVYRGIDNLEDAMVKGKGAILALPHLGSWEAGGGWLAASGYPMYPVVERLKPPKFFEWFLKLRQSVGLNVIPSDGDVTGVLADALGGNGVIVLPADRDLSGRGIEVNFFGEVTTMPAGPALLALRTGAALLPTCVFQRADGRTVGVVGPPLTLPIRGKLRDDLAELTQRLAVEFEKFIREAPEQWHMFQPNWPSDRLPAVARPA